MQAFIKYKMRNVQFTVFIRNIASCIITVEKGRSEGKKQTPNLWFCNSRVLLSQKHHWNLICRVFQRVSARLSISWFTETLSASWCDTQPLRVSVSGGKEILSTHTHTQGPPTWYVSEWLNLHTLKTTHTHKLTLAYYSLNITESSVVTGKQTGCNGVGGGQLVPHCCWEPSWAEGGSSFWRVSMNPW